jgi:glycosyltransferase involved in cell wall biosynthesis
MMPHSDFQSRRPMRTAVVAPTFNHGGMLPEVLAALKELGLPVIVVDDGSTDGTARHLDQWTDGRERIAVHHEKNRGKAAALQTGFAAAAQRGFTHAATIDTDGQHEVYDLPLLLEVSREHPEALIVGSRPRRIEGYPLGGRIGRALSNYFVWLESGVRVGDSQSGMRVYPLEGIVGLNARASRYAFETEVLTLAGWAGIAVKERQIRCRYRIPQGRVSHFRVVRDSAAGVRMHARLLARSCFPGRGQSMRVEAVKGGDGRTGSLFERCRRRLVPGRVSRRGERAIGLGRGFGFIPWR